MGGNAPQIEISCPLYAKAYSYIIVIAGDCGAGRRARRRAVRTYAVETTTVGKTNQNKIVGCDVSLALTS